MSQTLLQEAFQHVQRGELPKAETILARLPEDAGALHLLGTIRAGQHRMQDAEELLRRSIAINPNQGQAHINHAKVLTALRRSGEAIAALRTALGLEPGQDEAPLLLARLLLAARRFAEAESVAAAALRIGGGRKAQLLLCLSRAMARQRRPQAALEHLDQARHLLPDQAGIDLERAQLLEELQRFDEARAAYEGVLEHNPQSIPAHHAYNELLYRLGDDEAFLTSYAKAPATPELELAHAQFLLGAGRCDEAEEIFGRIVLNAPGHREAALGLGLARAKAGRIEEAVRAFEAAARLHAHHAPLYCNLAAALAQARDPQKAAAMAQRALALEPYNQVALAMLGTAWRMAADERDEALTGYDNFIRAFDLDPPEGFSSMADFNAELAAHLESLHPPVREYLRQSLRGGTQTADNIFDSGHPLIGKLRAAIAKAVDAYIQALGSDPAHPYLARRAGGFDFAGSWSSRLRDRGFHINHLHPGGWISSCYYIAVPPVTNDAMAKQGWIKFGEPSTDVGLPARRFLQPVAGRLLLFPSYMWHGTVPFHDQAARTTIAFDVLPRARQFGD